jgi:fused signal recognition particle receptor
VLWWRTNPRCAKEARLAEEQRLREVKADAQEARLAEQQRLREVKADAQEARLAEQQRLREQQAQKAKDKVFAKIGAIN